MPYRLVLNVLLILGVLIHSISQVHVAVQKNAQEGFVASYVTTLAVSAEPQHKANLEQETSYAVLAFPSLLFTVLVLLLVFFVGQYAVIHRHHYSCIIRAPPASIVF